MKKIFLIKLLVLVCSITAQAQDTDYQPLVREGVRWVNVHNEYREDESCYFYNYEFRGDTIINGKTYKKCYKYTGKSLDLSSDAAYCAMRDEGHKVFEVPLNMEESFGFTSYDAYWYNEYEVNGEFTLFDFDNPADPNAYAPRIPCPALKARIMSKTTEGDKFVPGIGFDSDFWGDAFHPYTLVCDCEFYDTYGLHHLEDLDGNVLYEGAAFDRVENVYAPLAREGVVWEYLYVNEDSTDCVERFQFMGDTIFSKGTNWLPTRFLKCYRYMGNELDTTTTPTTAYLQEVGRNVTVVTTPIQTHNKNSFIDEFGWTYSYPDYWGYEITGARDIYNFNYIGYFMQMLNEYYNCDYFSANDSVVSLVAVGDQMNRCFSITGIAMEDGKWIEGVGIDGFHTGNLIQPLAPSGATGTQGLIRLADLNGNTLYKGAYYRVAYELPKYDLNHDGQVDIADVNGVINMMLGKGDLPPADVTGDGRVDIADVNAVINAMLGKER